MKVEIPDHYVANVGGAMVIYAAEVIMTAHIVPAWTHQFADLWDGGLKFGHDGTFWEAVERHRPITRKYLKDAGVL